MTIEQLYPLFLQSSHVCTDTRKITDNCLFFALKGANFDGNKYAGEALEKGAKYAVVDNAAYASHTRAILVEDSLKALQELATYHRQQCKAKIIALTGSNGKTTTKELIHAVLAKKYRTIATKGNLNNHIGVPLTLLTIQPDTEMAVVEMGANHKKEIAFLCSIALPDYGYITNFGKAHLEGFGGEEGVIEGKSELYEHLIARKKPLFLNADDPIQQKKLGTYIHKYGFSQENHQYYIIQPRKDGAYVSLNAEDTIINTQLMGHYNFTNCCAAIVMGKYFTVALGDIKEALEGYVPQNNRSQILSKNGRTIILDAYNANPTSMQAALRNLHELEGSNKVAILGDMFELGNSAEKEHQAMADLASSLNFGTVFLVGNHFHKVKTPHDKFKTFEDFKNYFENYKIPEKSTLLIKGSRGMALERILDIL